MSSPRTGHKVPLGAMLGVAAASYIGAPVWPAEETLIQPAGKTFDSTRQVFDIGGKEILAIVGSTVHVQITFMDVPELTEDACRLLERKNAVLRNNPGQMGEIRNTLERFYRGIALLFPAAAQVGADNIITFTPAGGLGNQWIEGFRMDLAAFRDLTLQLNTEFKGKKAEEITASIQALCRKSLSVAGRYDLGSFGSVDAVYGISNGEGTATIHLGGRSRKARLFYDEASSTFRMEGLDIGLGAGSSLSLVPRQPVVAGPLGPTIPGFVDWNTLDARMNLNLGGSGVALQYNPASDSLDGQLALRSGSLPVSLQLRRTPVVGRPDQFNQSLGLSITEGSLKGAMIDLSKGRVTGSFSKMTGGVSLIGETDKDSNFLLSAAFARGPFQGSRLIYNPDSDAFEGSLGLGIMKDVRLRFVRNDRISDPKAENQSFVLQFAGTEGPIRDVNLEYQMTDPVNPFRGSLATDAGPAVLNISRLSDGTHGLSMVFEESNLLRGTWKWNPDRRTWEGAVGTEGALPAELKFSQVESTAGGSARTQAMQLRVLDGIFKDALLDYSGGVFSGTAGTSLGSAFLSVSRAAAGDSVSARFDNPLLKGLSFNLSGKGRTYTASLEREGRPYQVALAESAQEKGLFEVSVVMPELATGYAAGTPLVSLKLSSDRIRGMELNYGSQEIKISAGLRGAWGPPDNPMTVQGIISQFDAIYVPQQLQPGQKPPPDLFLPGQGTPMPYYLTFITQNLGGDAKGLTFILDENGNVDRARFMLKGKHATLRLGYFDEISDGDNERKLDAQLSYNDASLAYNEQTGVFSGRYELETSVGNLGGTLSLHRTGVNSTAVWFRSEQDSPYPVEMRWEDLEGKRRWRVSGTVGPGKFHYLEDGADGSEVQVGITANW